MSLTTLIVLCVWITGFFSLMLVKPKGVSTPAIVIMFTWPFACVYAAISLLLERKQKDDK